MKDLVNMIIDANEVRKETIKNSAYKKEMAQYITSINQRIKQAKEKGLTNTCFCGGTKYVQDLKEMYRNKGYSFKATGVIGGVWQDSEDICW